MTNANPASSRAGAADDLVSVKELADKLGIAESTAWLVVRRLNLPRYRVPARGKTTLVSLSEAQRAYNAPQRVAEGQ